MAKVLNKYALGNTSAAGGRYIGRGSTWGNRFVIGRDGDRDEVCDAHDRDLAEQILKEGAKARKLDDLVGQDVICFCAPKRCHGDTLVKLAAMSDNERIEWAQATIAAPPVKRRLF